jgi:predicted transcriptional regulator
MIANQPGPATSRGSAVLVRMPAGLRKALKQLALDQDSNVTEILREAAEALVTRKRASAEAMSAR